MKTLAASTALILAAVAATPAAAQSTSGQVNVSGFVSPRCGATYVGNPTFSGSISLGELSQQNGTLSPALANSTTSAPAGEMLFTVGCTSAASTVTLSATRLSNPMAGNSVTSNNVDYTAEVKIALANGGFANVTYRTAASAPPATVSALTDIYANQPNNFSVRAFALEADGGASSYLVTGNYTSLITITVSPT